MNVLHAICNEINDLVCSVNNACLLHCLRVTSKAVDNASKPHRYIAAGELHWILVIGMIPGMTGTSIPASRTLHKKL